MPSKLRRTARRAACLLCALSLFASDAQAQDAEGAYFGLTYGNLHYKNVNKEPGARSLRETSNQTRLVGGYRFNERLAFEASLAKSDIAQRSTEAHSGLWDVFYLDYSLDAEMKIRTVRAAGSVPYKHLSLFGTAGYYDAALKGTYGIRRYGYDSWYETTYEQLEGPYGLERSPSEFDHRSLAGVTLSGGIQADFDRGPSLRAEIEYYFTPSDVTAYAVSLGVLYRLGRRRPGRD